MKPLDDSVGNNVGADAYGHCQGDCDSGEFGECKHEIIGGGCFFSLVLYDAFNKINFASTLQFYIEKCLDSDCIGELRCFQRSADEEVPGCTQSVSIDPLLYTAKKLNSVANNMGTGAYGHCQGGEYLFALFHYLLFIRCSDNTLARASSLHAALPFLQQSLREFFNQTFSDCDSGKSSLD